MNVSFRPRGWHYRGYLPHFDGGQIAQTITFRLADSLPNKILARWERELSHQDDAKVEALLEMLGLNEARSDIPNSRCAARVMLKAGRSSQNEC